MVLENIPNITSINVEDILTQVSTLMTIFQAIGGLVVAYIVFNIINIFWNRKKRREIKKIRELLEEINTKLSKKR